MIRHCCKKHGELSFSKIYTRVRPNGNIFHECMECIKISSNKSSEKRRLSSKIEKERIQKEMKDSIEEFNNQFVGPLRLFKSCKHHGNLNHDEIGFSSSGSLLCRICVKERSIKYYHSHKEQMSKKARAYYLNNKDKVKLIRSESAEKNPPRPDKSLYASYRIRLSTEKYNEMLNNQNHVCKICKQKETTLSRTKNKPRRLSIDHCHKTNIIRGLLCSACNSMLGQAKDNISILQEGINYLKINGHDCTDNHIHP